MRCAVWMILSLLSGLALASFRGSRRFDAARVPELTSQLAADVEPFDPSRPDPPAAVAVPTSPLEPLSIPDGR